MGKYTDRTDTFSTFSVCVCGCVLLRWWFWKAQHFKQALTGVGFLSASTAFKWLKSHIETGCQHTRRHSEHRCTAAFAPTLFVLLSPGYFSLCWWCWKYCFIPFPQMAPNTITPQQRFLQLTFPLYHFLLSIFLCVCLSVTFYLSLSCTLSLSAGWD